MEVGFLDPVVIDDGEPADAGARQVLQHRAAQPAGADHQRPRRRRAAPARPRRPRAAPSGARSGRSCATASRRGEPALACAHGIGMARRCRRRRRRCRRRPRQGSARALEREAADRDQRTRADQRASIRRSARGPAAPTASSSAGSDRSGRAPHSRDRRRAPLSSSAWSCVLTPSLRPARADRLHVGVDEVLLAEMDTVAALVDRESASSR